MENPSTKPGISWALIVILFFEPIAEISFNGL
jgi:hypothetical protein